jgi:hypothetical protein
MLHPVLRASVFVNVLHPGQLCMLMHRSLVCRALNHHDWLPAAVDLRQRVVGFCVGCAVHAATWNVVLRILVRCAAAMCRGDVSVCVKEDSVQRLLQGMVVDACCT